MIRLLYTTGPWPAYAEFDCGCGAQWFRPQPCSWKIRCPKCGVEEEAPAVLRQSRERPSDAEGISICMGIRQIYTNSGYPLNR